MPAYSQEHVPIELEAGVAQTRTIHQGGMAIAFERLSAGVEAAPLFKGLPGDACQSPHWGYLIEGRLRVLSDRRDRGVDRRRAGVLPAEALMMQAAGA